MQVVQIRNSLAHIKQSSHLNLDDQTFNAYWTDIKTLVNCLPLLSRPYFTKKTAQDVIAELNEVSFRHHKPGQQPNRSRPTILHTEHRTGCDC